MSSILVLQCKKCGAPVDPGARGSFTGTRSILVDAACGACGKRALYQVPQVPAAGN